MPKQQNNKRNMQQAQKRTTTGKTESNNKMEAGRSMNTTQQNKQTNKR